MSSVGSNFIDSDPPNHKMLNIVHLPTEILGLIAVDLRLDHEHDLDDSVANRLERNEICTRHLARLAGTCRRFYDIANPILWRRDWKKALLFSAEHGRHAIIDFLADNQSKLCLDGLDAGANCFDYQFSQAEHQEWDVYDQHSHKEELQVYEKEWGEAMPLYPAIIVTIMDRSPNQDPAATVKHLIKRGAASPYVPLRNYCHCLDLPARRSGGWQSMLHAILCGEGDSFQDDRLKGRFEIVHQMLRDITDFDLTRAYWGRGLLWDLIRTSNPLNGAPEHLSDIIDLLVTRYGLDVNSVWEDGIARPRPLHSAILAYNYTYLYWITNPRIADYIPSTISHLFRLGADPSLAVLTRGWTDPRPPFGSMRRLVTAIGVFLEIWNERNDEKRLTYDKRYKNWPWRRLANVLVSNGARCHFDGNWESPGLFDFACFMDALEIACDKRDVDMLRLLVDDLAPTLRHEGLFTPKLWGLWEQFRDSVKGAPRPRIHEGESTKTEWWTARGVEANWATYFAECSREWEKWQTEEWVEGVSLLAKLPFSADDG